MVTLSRILEQHGSLGCFPRPALRLRNRRYEITRSTPLNRWLLERLSVLIQGVIALGRIVWRVQNWLIKKRLRQTAFPLDKTLILQEALKDKEVSRAFEEEKAAKRAY